MDILQIAIEAEGGVGKLAAALDERQSTVSNWKARGLPRSWLKVLTLKYQPREVSAGQKPAPAAEGAVTGRDLRADDQREMLPELSQAPENRAQPATETVAAGGV